MYRAPAPSIATLPRLLFVDDSPVQLALYRDAFSEEFEVSLASNYQEAMAALTRQRPEVVVLDVIMPQMDGLEFLSILKGSQSFDDVPVVMVSVQDDQAIVRDCFLKGAADYVRKPFDREELSLRIQRLLPGNARRTAPGALVTARSMMVRALADLARSRDNETGFHLDRIEAYTGLLARAVLDAGVYAKDLSPLLLESIAELSVLHDIGKVGIPDAILRKPGPLTPEEAEVMKTHTFIGGETIRRVREQFPEYAFLQFAQDIALHHHERWDGRGYPAGLAGEAIPLAARMVSVVDVFDALTTQRVYKPALSLKDAHRILASEKGRQLDPVLYDVFWERREEFHEHFRRWGGSA